MAIAVIVAIFSHKEVRETRYSLAICHTDGIAETTDGNLWGDSDFVNGNQYRILFDTKGTEDITDDEIIEVVKVGI